MSGAFRGPNRGKKTEFNGVLFRSELEATWAHHFESYGMKWHYEPCRIRLQGKKSYTPDFSLPESRMLIQVKPDEPTFEEFWRAAWACDIMGGCIYFVCGYPGVSAYYKPRLFGNNRYGFEPCKIDGFPVRI
jgi:hypothetical protein